MPTSSPSTARLTQTTVEVSMPSTTERRSATGTPDLQAAQVDGGPPLPHRAQDDQATVDVVAADGVDRPADVDLQPVVGETLGQPRAPLDHRDGRGRCRVQI